MNHDKLFKMLKKQENKGFKDFEENLDGFTYGSGYTLDKDWGILTSLAYAYMDLYSKNKL
jgi:hypothetical protein